MKNEFMDEMTSVTCQRCSWSGPIKNTQEVVKHRHGIRFHKQLIFEYLCPECRVVLAQDIREARMKDQVRKKPLSNSQRAEAEI